MTLNGPASPASFIAAIWSVQYENTSDDPNLAVRTLSFTVHDGVDPSNIVTRNIVITPFDDIPELDLDANDSSGATGDD